MPPTIAITAGDPCGIGPEVILKAMARLSRLGAQLLILGDHTVFKHTASRLGLTLPRWQRVHPGERWQCDSRHVVFLDLAGCAGSVSGTPLQRAGAASLAYLEHAVGLWRAGKIQALVTAPVTKWAIAQATPGFIGQTEYLSRAMRARDVVMMFASDRLRVALVTRHVPLGRVPHTVTRKLLRTTIRLTARALEEQFGIRHPRLAVCGINPHAGEATHVGMEEARVIQPVIRALRRRERLACEGPFAADGLFACLPHRPAGRRQTSRPRYDAIICLYHDQGLIPFKMVARDRGCQVSIGLPIPRTSPDHGSARDIAGRGMADPGSMVYAVRLAAHLAQRRHRA